MAKKNIWGSINFSDKKEKSAYDLLIEQSEGLAEATAGVLKMQVEAIDAFDEKSWKPVALYMLYVVAPQVGNFRRKILTVYEYSHYGRFPVDIISHLDNSETEKKISKENFIGKIEEILSRPIVKHSIENLYKMSKENITHLNHPNRQIDPQDIL